MGSKSLQLRTCWDSQFFKAFLKASGLKAKQILRAMFFPKKRSISREGTLPVYNNAGMVFFNGNPDYVQSILLVGQNYLARAELYRCKPRTMKDLQLTTRTLHYI